MLNQFDNLYPDCLNLYVCQVQDERTQVILMLMNQHTHAHTHTHTHTNTNTPNKHTHTDTTLHEHTLRCIFTHLKCKDTPRPNKHRPQKPALSQCAERWDLPVHTSAEPLFSAYREFKTSLPPSSPRLLPPPLLRLGISVICREFWLDWCASNFGGDM